MDHKDQRRVWFSYHAAVVLVISNSIRLFPGLLTPQSLAAQCVKAFRKTFVSQSGFELSTKPSKQEKAAPGKAGFVPAVARWVIERSNAWRERCKSLVKNFERTLAHATTKLNLCFVRLMLKRLAATS
jgi:hypothetical protein